MGASWNFLLCDAGGNNLAELATASGRTVAYKRNRYAEVQFTISHEDDAASLLLGALANTGVPRLKCYRRGPNDPLTMAAPLRFRGYLAALSETSEETSLLTATFRSPFGVLVGDGSQAGRFLQTLGSPGVRGLFPTVYNNMDAGLIAKALIDTANSDSPTGLATDPSLIETTVTRNCVYPPAQNIGTAITDLSEVLDGFDFFESPVDGVGTIDAYFNVVASLGSVNTTARFEYGETTLSNLANLTRTTTPPQNCILVIGGNGMTSTYIDTNSVAMYGRWWGYYDESAIVDQGTLDARARALCRPDPIKTLTLIPELALDSCPKPFDDFNLGDTVPVFARRGALAENAQVRIDGFTIPISDAGEETMQITDPNSPEADATVRASFTASEIVT